MSRSWSSAPARSGRGPRAGSSAAAHRSRSSTSTAPGNSLSSSGDESRVTRSAHGVDAHYPSGSAAPSSSGWRSTGRCSSRPASSGWRDATTDSRPTPWHLERLGIPAERLDVDALRERFPQMLTDDLAWALHEPEAGVLMARRAVAATARGRGR